MSLKLIQVDHSYGKRAALQGVNLEIHPGDCYGFIGHNGAGKTTAMRIALGLIQPTHGRVVVDGYDAHEFPLEARARMGGLIERPGFFDYWDGPRNLRMLAKLQGLDSKTIANHCDELMELVGLGHVLDLPVRAYSQGMRQRLGIAQALMGRPRYLLLDEPGNGLDPEGLAEMRRLLQRLTRDEGMTVLLSSHQLHEVAEICNRIAVLKKGKVLLEDDAQGILLSGRPLFEFKTSKPEEAQAAMVELGLKVEQDISGGLIVDVGEVPPSAINKALVEKAIPLDSFSRKAPSLEEIYLEIQTPKSAKSAEGKSEESKDEAQGERLSPPREILRAMGYEWRRLCSRKIFFASLTLPFLVAFWDIRSRFALAEAALQKMAEDGLASTTDVTAFEGVAWGLRTSLILASMIFCGLASQSLAGELDRGTLRNALLRPVRRSRLAIGKLLTLLSCAAVTYVALIGFVYGVSAYYFDFSPLVEILPNGEFYDYIKLDVLEDALSAALISGLLPMLTYTLLGFAAGALARNPTAALIYVIGGVFGLDLLRSQLPARSDEKWLPSSHLPSKLGDTSFLRHYEDVVTNVSNVTEVSSQYYLVPWCLLSFLIAVLVVAKRDVR